DVDPHCRGARRENAEQREPGKDQRADASEARVGLRGRAERAGEVGPHLRADYPAEQIRSADHREGQHENTQPYPKRQPVFAEPLHSGLHRSPLAAYAPRLIDATVSQLRMLRHFMRFAGSLFYGWVIVAVAFVTMAIGVNARTAFSLLFAPIVDEFGWDRGATAAAFSFGFILAAVLSPLLGKWMDRFGPRPVLEAGIACVAVGLLAAAHIRSP